MSFPLFNSAELDCYFHTDFKKILKTEEEKGIATSASGHKQRSVCFCLLKKDVSMRYSPKPFFPFN